uniref:Uncharacterized protein n=1 Tax=Cuerna arida TaxID=1464854 RepID=A0A1B6G0W4_9HEMI
MDENIAMFTLLYILISSCFVIRTDAFSGLSVENLCSRILGSEMDNFIFYNIKRSSCTLFIHSSLLLVYRLGVSWVANYPLVEDDGMTIFNIIGTLGIVMLITASVIIYYWKRNNWENHPISRKLIMLSENDGSWRNWASAINIDLRRQRKVVFRCSSLVKLVVTENWIVKVSPYTMDIAHQRGATLTVDTADIHALADTGPGIAQFLNIKVTNTRRASYTFYIRNLNHVLGVLQI